MRQTALVSYVPSKVERTEYLQVPVRVEYASTEKADKLMPVLEAFSDWGEEMMK